MVLFNDGNRYESDYKVFRGIKALTLWRPLGSVGAISSLLPFAHAPRRSPGTHALLTQVLLP